MKAKRALKTINRKVVSAKKAAIVKNDETKPKNESSPVIIDHAQLIFVYFDYNAGFLSIVFGKIMHRNKTLR